MIEEAETPPEQEVRRRAEIEDAVALSASRRFTVSGRVTDAATLNALRVVLSGTSGTC